MPPEPLPTDRKDFLEDRKPSSSEPVESVPPRWTDSPTTPSSDYYSRGSPSSCRWGGGGGCDFRRPFTGHGKSAGDGWHVTSVESGSPVSMDPCSLKDRNGGDFRGTSASPTGNSHPQSDFVNPWDQLQLNDQQHAKSSGDGVSSTCSQRLEKAVSLGSSLDWKPLKWSRSGSLSSRGSGFSHLSSCKVVGVDSIDMKMEAQPGSGTLVSSPSGDAAICLTPKTLEEATSRKKPRLGWGEGLAKYEKKKVDPDDIVDKENGSRNGMVDGVSSTVSLLPGPSLPGKSPCLNGNSESASPTASCPFARSLSPGLEEKASTAATTMDNDACNPGVALSQNHSHGLPFNLENFDLAEDFNLSSSLDDLLQTDDATGTRSGFAMDKLQVWKADISRAIEITESEIDSLENELKSLTSDEDSCPFPPASGSFLKLCNNDNTVDLRNTSSVAIPIEKPDIFPGGKRDSAVCLDIGSKKVECSKAHVCRDGGHVSAGSSCTVSVGSAIYYGRKDKLYDPIWATNKALANETSDELSKLLPATNLCTDIVRFTNDSVIKKRIAMRKRFLKFKERVITLKFRGFQYSWKENLRLLTVRSGAKSQKFELSSRLGYIDSQKLRSSNHSRSSILAGCLRLVPTKEVVEYVKELLLDSRVKTFRNAQKMPTFILDRRERMSSRFISDNGLVENPIEVEKERSLVNTWTEEDRQLFLDKYALFGKNFRKIASFFRHKTVADCVEFYYKNHKSESFQKTKKNSKFAKGKSSNFNANNTYLVTSGKRQNRETGATSLDMLGAASAMVANVDEQSNDFASYCNEQETAAADVLAGICGSISSEALGSCITSSVDYQKLGRRSLNDVDEETCSDDSCEEEMNSSIWTDEERSTFIKAVKSYGKDFSMISRCMGTRSSDQCRVFFSKVKKCFGLDVMDLGAGSEGTMRANQGGDDQDDTCMVDSGSGISQDKSSMECKMDVEDLHSSDFREHVDSGRNVATDCREPERVVEDKVGGNLEGAADSEALNLEESPQTTCSNSASGAKVEEHVTLAKSARICTEGLRECEHELPGTMKGSSYCPLEDLNSVSCYSRGTRSDLTTDQGNNLDLNAASENVTCQEADNGLVMPNLFPQDSNLQRKTVSCQDDASSRLTFRKSGQRSSSIDGYKLNLHKRSLSSNEPQFKLKLDESLLLPRDDCIQMGTDLTSVTQQQRRSSSLDIEKPSKSGDVKLFGQIITNHSLPKPKSSAQENEKPDAGKSSNLSFDQCKTKDYAFGVENDIQLKRNYGFWDKNRIQTGFSSLPGSALLLAKYPAAFSNMSTLPKLDPHRHSSLERGNDQCNNLDVVSGFQTRKLTNHNRGPNYNAYGQPFTVDKLLPEMSRIEALSTSVGVMNVVGGACNGVSDPVAAIRMHYAKTEQYKNGGADSWRSNVSDIGSR